ncbi:hypothetical protein [Photobacterium indicum]|uniref:Nucleoside 2-deoxyribosyltransferase n=1 Tax=Photobacterium indicum TaxID=81447 RepID=A0A2T3L3Y7_9GAMM|nr:hypothetical protein [Photobacterium indicum]PSV44053.1 hypothetical protein C9J47_20540 [Photobacterium indicum]
MGKSIFLSYPRPYNDEQQAFIDSLSVYLCQRGYEPRTLGVTDYDMDAPLKAIRRLMLESNGLITIAFRRAQIIEGIGKPNTSDVYSLNGKWLTSPYSHIEPAMAFQIGLPVLIIREVGVIADGILEQGVLGTYMPEFNLENSPTEYLESNEFAQVIRKWESQVERVVENKGSPPQLY